MDYIRFDRSTFSWHPEPFRLDDAHWNEVNPYRIPEPEDGLSGSAWTAWFHAVKATNPSALKSKVPHSLHCLLDGEVPCPACGATLGYEPRDDRWHMTEVCPKCGHTSQAIDREFSDACHRRHRWFRERHLPASLSEYHLWQSIQEHREAAREVGSGQEAGDGTSSTSSRKVVLAAGLAIDYETGTVYPTTMSLEEAIERTNY